MRYSQFYSKLYGRPLLLESSARLGLEAALEAMIAGHKPVLTDQEIQTLMPGAPSFRAAKQDPMRAQKRMDGLLEMRGRDAIIHIDGPIDKHMSALDLFCYGGVDLNDVDAALAAADADPAVQNIMLLINSPGGSITGVPETAARIADIATRKNVFAYSDSMCCSAAYWLASQADQVFATASANYGSVGVYMALLDKTRALEAAGLKVETVKAGALKAAGASWRTLSEAERAHFQEQVDNIAVMFKAAVLDKRPGIDPAALEGQSLMGAQALRAGLVDGLVSGLDEALAQF